MKVKEQLIELCKQQQLDTIKVLESTMKEIQENANDYGAPKDRYDSYRNQLSRKRDMIAKQLLKANEQFAILNQIDLSLELKKVEFGALVETSQQKLLIAISLGKLQLNNEEYFAISPAVPIYQAMDGKIVGEEFEFRGKSYMIEDIR